MEAQKLIDAIALYRGGITSSLRQTGAEHGPFSSKELKIATLQDAITEMYEDSEIRRNIISTNVTTLEGGLHE